MNGTPQALAADDILMSHLLDNASRILEEWRETYEKTGDGEIVLFCINLCAHFELAMPEWLGTAFSQRYKLFWSAEVYELGEAFGVTRPKGFNLNALRKMLKYQEPVYYRIKTIHDDEGKPIDQALFNAVGQEFFISGSTARDYYYKYTSYIQSAYKDLRKFL